MRFQCPFCRGIVAVENSDMGTDVQCGHCGEIVTVPCSRLATGAVIADFIILEELGRGGMGIVYLAHQISLDRPAAVKILADNFANNAEFVVNFIKEARAAAKLNHPHIVQAYAVGEDEGIFYFAMEHIDGETMKQVLRREKIIPIDRSITIIQQIAEALDYAWKEAKLIHRDIKPDNIMLTKNGRAKLADLGLSKVAGDSDDSESDEVMGTPQYISPEHLTGAPMDGRSDIYSLGATFYHLITGRFPFEGRTATEIARKHLEERLVPPHLINPEIPIAIGQIIEKMMAKNIKNRYQDAEQLVDDLRMVRRGKKPPTATQGVKALPTQTRLSMSVTATREQLQTQLRTINMHLTGMMTGKVPTGTVADLDSIASLEVKRQRRKIVILIFGIVAVLLIGVTFFFTVVSGNGGGKAPVKLPTTTPTNNNTVSNNAPAETKPPAANTPYARRIAKIMEFYDANPERKSEILGRVDDFLEDFPTPGSQAELQLLNKLLKVFIPLDETMRVSKARETLEEKYFQELEKNALEKQRQIEQKRTQHTQSASVTSASRAAETQARQNEQQRKKQEQEFVDKCRKEQLKARQEIVGMLIKNDYEPALALLSALPDILRQLNDNSTPAEREAANRLADWSRLVYKGIKKGERIYNDVYNGGGTLAGINIEISVGDLVTIREVRNGIMEIKSLTGGDENKITMKELPLRIIRQLANKAAKLIDDEDGYFFFLMTQGLFYRKIKNLCPGEAWQKEFSLFAVEYFKQQLNRATDSQREEMEKNFGSMPEFQEARKS